MTQEQNLHAGFERGYKNRHGKPVSDACGEGQHAQCQYDLTQCFCTYRGLHTVTHAYVTIPAPDPNEPVKDNQEVLTRLQRTITDAEGRLSQSAEPSRKMFLDMLALMFACKDRVLFADPEGDLWRFVERYAAAESAAKTKLADDFQNMASNYQRDLEVVERDRDEWQRIAEQRGTYAAGLERERDSLREALERYGKHDYQCVNGDAACSCGLSAALKTADLVEKEPKLGRKNSNPETAP